MTMYEKNTIAPNTFSELCSANVDMVVGTSFGVGFERTGQTNRWRFAFIIFLGGQKSAPSPPGTHQSDAALSAPTGERE